MHSRIQQILDVDDAEVPDINWIAALERLRGRRLGLAKLLSTYAAERERTLDVVRELRDDQLKRGGG